MGENISKEHSRRAMKMLEDLTGGLITKEDILFFYKTYRRRGYSRTNALWEAFEANVFKRYQQSSMPKFEVPKMGYKEYKELLGDYYHDFRVATISYPEASPVKFILEVYEMSPDIDRHYIYSLYVKEGDNLRVLYNGVYGEKYNSELEAFHKGLEGLVESMVVYALEKTAHKEEPDVLFKA